MGDHARWGRRVKQAIWLSCVCVLAGCWAEDPLVDDTFTDEQWRVLQGMKLPEAQPCPPELDGMRCDLAVQLGKQLFFERALSGPITISDPGALGASGEPGKIACRDCHDPQKFFVDTRSNPNQVSIGAGYTKHNALGLVNLGYKSVVAAQNCARPDADELCAVVFSWNGQYSTAGGVLNLAALGKAAMNSSKPQLAQVVHDNADYLTAYVALFAGYPPVGGTCKPTEQPCHSVDDVFANLSLVFDAYVRRLESSTPSRFDQYITGTLAGDRTTSHRDALDEHERRGLAVFLGKAMCVECHRGPLLSDLQFHNTGVAQRGPHVPALDGGLADFLTDKPQYLGRFLTPPLRNVAATGPYMHAGQVGSLADVIEFYRRGGDPDGFSGLKDARIEPLEITDDEARDLEAFLRTLTGGPVPDSLTRAP
ncbi:MAG TPA: cytochrome c peroxidase [Kofleriaceae bacterium]|nr:cytochrome c peroxidase [Kofleriaceae bacterium]